MSGLLTWILGNPLVSALSAAILALGLYAGVQHFSIVHLEAQNATLKANELTRQAQAKEAFRKNEQIESANAAKTKRLQNDAVQAQKSADRLYADNKRLLAGLRIGSDRNTLPETGRSPPGDSDACSRPILSGDCPAALVEMARSADYLRQQVLACQAFVK